MPTASQFIKKILRQRYRLLKNNIGNCSAQMEYAYAEVKKYANYYNNEQALINWMKRNVGMVKMLVPHNPKNQKEFDELNQLLSA